MTNTKVGLASEKDRKQLLEFFKHYKVREAINNMVACYLSHNFSVIAKYADTIVGLLQWHVKENPKLGLVEFEEVFVVESHRRKGIGTLLLEYAIQSVRDYFRKIGIKHRKIFLFVGKNNASARALYERHGFRFISEVGNLFFDTETELFYSLNL